jgi:hypothetical protein
VTIFYNEESVVGPLLWQSESAENVIQSLVSACAVRILMGLNVQILSSSVV